MSKFDPAKVSAPFLAALMIAAAAACSSGGSGTAIVADDEPARPGGETAAADGDQAGKGIEGVAGAEPGPAGDPPAETGVGRDVGDRVVDFSVTLEDGAILTSSQIAERGRPVFIYFHATWCPVCRKDLSVLADIYPDYADAVDLIVVGQDPTEPIEDLVSNRDDAGYVWPVALAGPRMLADLRITTQSYKLALSAEGVITYRAGLGSGNAQVWREVLADLAG